MNILNLLELLLIIFPLIISVISLFISIKNKKKFWHIISGCINFALAVYVPMCMFSYFYYANFIGKSSETDIGFLINEVGNNSNEACSLLLLIIMEIIISIINYIYIFRKSKKLL